MTRFWSPLVAELSPYTPGEQPKADQYLKLNTNELPWSPSPKVAEVIAAINVETLRCYPDPESIALCGAWARQLGIAPEQVFIGNGSDEVLAHTCQALFNPARPVLFPDISYSFYPVYCGLYRLPYGAIPVDSHFNIRLEDYRRENGGILFPNPNAPTGIALPLAQLETLLQVNTDSVVVVDEAYVDFGAESAVALIDTYDNLLVIQTLSKSRGLAGLRVGAAFGNTELIEALKRVKNSFNSYPVDRIAEAVAVAAVQDKDWFDSSCARMKACRNGLLGGLQALGFSCLPSAANFVMVRHESRTAVELFAALRERKILVRYFSRDRTSNYLRITVGTEQECSALLGQLRDILGLGEA